MKLGSLFDGSGGFPAAGLIAGLETAWTAEIEPFPRLVSQTRFPKAKQLGDVTKINGAEIEPVDIICAGSPCQDISIAGAQKGIHEGLRSRLFFEAIRIAKEMREATDGKYPSVFIWENVPGAFSSNKGMDFAAVLSAFVELYEGREFPVPVPEGGWKPAGCVMGERGGAAWRVYDAQYWGVAQRRKRIYLVAGDLGRITPPQVLFERQSLPGHPEPSITAWKAFAADAGGGAE